MEQLIARMYSFHMVVMVACALFYYRAAVLERAPAILWTGLSVLVFLVTWLVLSWGLLGCLGGQVGLLAAITLVKLLHAKGTDR